MKTSTVVDLQSTGQSWVSQRGDTFYTFDIALEDGTSGQVNSRNPEKPPYAIGDEVEYEVQRENAYGKTLKVQLPRDGSPSAGKASSFNSNRRDDVGTRIDASWAIGQVLSVAGGKIDLNSGAHLVQLKSRAVTLIRLRDDIVAHLQKHHTEPLAVVETPAPASAPASAPTRIDANKAAELGLDPTEDDVPF